MSADTSRPDVSHINDEDVLKKMWQDTEDFGHKKEIRAHMYKLREARLRDFYNTGEAITTNSSENNSNNNTTSMTTTSSSTSSTMKKSSSSTAKTCGESTTHADSLADHSFLSMKSKEIRDSESPTRDISYRVTDKIGGGDHLSDQGAGWQIITSNTTSDDGKTHTTSKLATTSGSEKIAGGHLDYMAKNQQQASVYQDGDENNFTKAVGASSNTMIKQEASGGDDNSQFKMSSTKTTSTSKIVSEKHGSTMTGTGHDDQRQIRDVDDSMVTRQVYNTNNAPKNLKNHPNYIDGKTKVTTETRTLPDGSTVTTTKYETKSGNSTSTATVQSTTSRNEQYSSSNKSTSATSNNQTIINNSKIIADDSKALQLINNTTNNNRQNIINSNNPSGIDNDSFSTTSTTQTTVTSKYSTDNLGKLNIDQQSHTTSNKTSTTDASDGRTLSKQIYDSDQPQLKENKQTIMKTTATKYIDNDVNTYDTKHQTINKNINEDFINIEQHNLIKEKPLATRPATTSVVPDTGNYEMPERRQPIKPGKSELDVKTNKTTGQYDTTYRSEFTNKKISVEVSPTHDAFARSLRAVSPDRISKCSSPSRTSLRTSTNSLRSTSTSPEKNLRSSPDRRSRSPKKTTTNISTSTTAATKINKEIDSSTLTRRKKSPSRASSPTSIASDIEFIRHTNADQLLTTDLDTNETTITKRRIDDNIYNNTSQTRKINDRSKTSPLIDSSVTTKQSPTKESTPRRSSLHSDKPINKDRPFIRTDTYDERCREILGISNDTTSKRRGSDEKRFTTNKLTDNKKKINEFPSQIRKSPVKEPLDKYPERKSPTKEGPKINEFPSQIRKVPVKEALEKYPERKSPTKEGPKINEFPSQIRKSPVKEPLEKYPERKRPTKDGPKINEFPSQIRKSPVKEPFEKYPEKKSPTKEGPKINEFPSQIRKSPVREPLEKYPERKSPTKEGLKINEFPSQIRKSPVREPLEKYPERKSPTKEGPKINEFPSQIRKSPEREPLDRYPERKSPTKDAPSSINEFPSQIRKSPVREPLEKYPERRSPTKEGPKINEFPSQIRKSPEREPLDRYPERKSPTKNARSSINEFPSQIRKSPVKEPLDKYPERKSPTKEGPKINEFPSQIRKVLLKEPLEKYPEKKSPTKEGPKINEFPSQIRKSPERELLDRYPERKNPTKAAPSSINEFPSQIRKSPERQLINDYPEKVKPTKYVSKINEFPAQNRQSPDRESPSDLIDRYPARTSPTKISELPSQLRKSPEKEEPSIIDNYSKETKPRKPDAPKVQEFPSQIRKSPERNKSPTKSDYASTIVGINKPTKQRNTSLSSSSSDDEEEDGNEEIIEVEEITIKKERRKIDDLNEKIPVKEPVVTKKFIDQLCRDEELQQQKSTNINRLTTKKDTKINELDNNEITKHHTVKKDLSSSQSTKKVVNNETFIEKEKINTRNQVSKGVVNIGPIKKKEPTELKEKPKPTTTTSVNKKRTSSSVHDTTERTTINKTNRIIDDSSTTTRIAKKSPTTKKTAIAKNDEALKKTTTVTPKRHVVSTTITVSPKAKTVNNNKIIVTTKTIKTKLQNGHNNISTVDTDNTVNIDNNSKRTTTTTNKQQIATKITNNERIKTSTPKSQPIIRGLSSKPELIATTTITPKTEKNTVTTTKSILINNDDDNIAEAREIIVNLQRSKSSREPTPDRLCPLPISSISSSSSDEDEEDENIDIHHHHHKSKHQPSRYPDEITEPDDISNSRSRKTKKYIDDYRTPIVETEEEQQYNINEEESTTVNRVDETDESLLSVNKKISKFLDTAEKLTRSTDSTTIIGPTAPKVERPKFEIDDDLEKDDECLLSVSEKVNRFITTAEQLLTKPQIGDVSDRPKSPKCQQYYPNKTTIIDNDKDTLSVSDKVTKYISKSKEQPISLSRIDIKPSSKPTAEINVDVITTRQKSPSPIRDRATTPTNRRLCNQYSTVKNTDTTVEQKYSRRDSSPKQPDSTPKSTRRLSDDDHSLASTKLILSPTNRLRSTESIKRAKALFETNTTTTKITDEKDDLKSTRLVIDRLRQKSKSPEPRSRSREQTPLDDDSDLPGYMRPLDRSLRPNSPHRDSISQINKKLTVHQSEDELDNRVTSLPSTTTTTTKFGVTLKRTDSGRTIPITNSTNTTSIITDRSKQTDSSKKTTITVTSESEIEVIYDLELLEELLERVVSYDLRRKIRAQIRLVKKLIAENKLEITIKQLRKSPEKTKPSTINSDTLTKSKTSIKDAVNSNKSSEYNYSTTTKTNRRSSSPTQTKTSPYRNKSPETKPLKEKSKTPTRTLSGGPDSNYSSKTTTISTNLFQSQLKKTAAAPNAIKNRPTTTDDDNKPEWVRERNLRKTSTDDRASTTTRRTSTSSSTTTTTTTTKSKKDTSNTTKRSSSPLKESKPTDIITSSYGVGPTDENGAPLFGLKALRSRNQNDTTTKIQGTVIKSQYYSENGNEPIGQISVTKYSTDPKDLKTTTTTTTSKDHIGGRNNRNNITSVTTTQKFGYKDTPSLKNLQSKKTTSETNAKTSKVTRRGSVKALSQKFIDSAVETEKSERQSSYPKAGLILRTSSFKDCSSTTSSGRESREISPLTMDRTVALTKTTRGGVDSFLTNRSRITDVQDVISRMTAEDIRDGDSLDDIEAKGLLNKFLGSQVILSGLETTALSSSSSSSKTTRTTKTSSSNQSMKVTTTVMEGGKAVKKTHHFQIPITEKVLKTIWDEQTIRLLLEQSTDYEERRLIRARLRQIMEEQEACTDLVEKASQETTKTGSGGTDRRTIEGESLLLPLLQGLLEAPDAEQTGADSGTESGEDQRNGLIIEVQNALNKLATSLRSDAGIAPERRCSLLQLVDKLQAGLTTTSSTTSSTPTTPNERRFSQSHHRFNRRRQRPNRHTVGVSSEELADARRLIEEIAMNPGEISAHKKPPEEKLLLLPKQRSEGSVVAGGGGINPAVVNTRKPIINSYNKSMMLVKNATPKPFSSSNCSTNSNTTSATSSTVQTPSESCDNVLFLLNNNNEQMTTNSDITKNNSSAMLSSSFKSISLDLDDGNNKRPILSATNSLDLTSSQNISNLKSTVQQAAAIKLMTAEQIKTQQVASSQESETDDDASTVKGQTLTSDIEEEEDEEEEEDDEEEEEEDEEEEKHNEKDENTCEDEAEEEDQYEVEEKLNIQKNRQNQPDLIMQSNPIYYPDPEPFDRLSHEEKCNRFTTKKLKMKRANTIDIPKPLKFYEDDEDSDCSMIEDFASRRRSNYLALRGPIRVDKDNMPVFQPKTDNDLKFLAFINKHNNENNTINNGAIDNNNSKSSLWSKQSNSSNRVGTIWNNKFGNIKTAFENKAASLAPPAPTSNISARKFWQTTDDTVNIGKTYGPKISKQNARNLQQMFEEKRQQQQQQQQSNIVTGSLQVSTTRKIPEQSYNKFTASSQPQPFNKFSHAPQSAFKPISPKPPSTLPIIKTTPIATNSFVMKTEIVKSSDDEPLYLYSPKPQQQQHDSSTSTTPSPNHHHQSKPWINNNTNNEHRVLSLAASKFELQQQQPITEPTIRSSTRRFSKENNFFTQQQQTAKNNEKLGAPFLVKNAVEPRNAVVRKMSGQYDEKIVGGDNPNNYSTYSTVKYAPPSSSQYYQPQQQTSSRKSEQVIRTNSLYSPQPESAPAEIEEYTSTFVYQPKLSPTSTSTNTPSPQPQIVETRPKYEKQLSNGTKNNENIKEYTAVSSKVMIGPVCQQAETVRQKSPMSRNEHDMAAAFNLRNTLQQKVNTNNNINNKSDLILDHKRTSLRTSQSLKYPTPKQQVIPNNNHNNETPNNYVDDKTSNSFKYKITEKPQTSVLQTAFKFAPTEQPKKKLSQNSFKIKEAAAKIEQQQQLERRTNKNPRPKLIISNNKPNVMPSLQQQQQQIKSSWVVNESNDGQSVVTSKFHIPVINVMATSPGTPKRLPQQQPPTLQQTQNKAQTWHQICAMQQIEQKNSPPQQQQHHQRHNLLNKSKSSHSLLAVPKLYEAGMSKDEMAQKKRTMEAFISGTSKSPSRTSSNENVNTSTIINNNNNNNKDKVVKRSINRIKTSEKMSAYHHHRSEISTSSSSGGLARSRTLPDIVCPDMLDESNVDKAFEDLFKSNTVSKTKKIVTEGPVTTTQVTTTKVTSQQQTKKPISPFAKFRQLDKQNSLNTPPSTPKSPSGSGPLFKFTDASLTQSASTVKDRLLYWCKVKTKEYENIQLDNFSSSWADGLAFCALIHHFLPDAFDYHALTPKNRRHNFSLAFQVADEKADIAPLLDVEDMIVTRKPDWKCVFTYVQSIYRRFKDED